jgi:outer membrane lipopolysaccharide assembly protein LptE/RlpB
MRLRMDSSNSVNPPRRAAARALVSAVGWLIAIFCVAGCSHYQLGTGGKLSFATLYVAPVANKAILPQAQAIVSNMLREELLHDGRVTLVDSPDAADATLTLVLNDYHRDVATVQPGDTGLAREFALTLTATVTLHDNRTSKDLFEKRPITAVRDAYTDSGQLQAEYQALPLLAGVLAKKAAHAVLDVW